MFNAILLRLGSTEQGTLGILVAPDFMCRTIELPWHDNKQNISCIPEGVYTGKPHKSNRHGRTYYISDVEGRSCILSHSGNYAGDKEKGFLTHSYGCIILGSAYGILGGQLAVLLSRKAMRNFLKYARKQTMQLTIKSQ